SLWNDCTQTQLASVAELVNIKAEGHISKRIYDRISQWADHILPCDHIMPLDYYNTKKLIRDLGLPVENIDACRNGYMLYLKDRIDLDYCKFCGEAWYNPAREQNSNRKKTPYVILGYLPLTPRLQSEACNVKLGLCMDGFAPHGQYCRTYSYWPIILISYNLLPEMCMSSEYIFLMIAIPDPSNPKRLIDVYIESLIEELQNLWHVGVLTHDNTKNETFTMCVALMWTVNDLHAYGMVSRWSKASVMGCPVYMEDAHAFYLQNGRNAYYFDCHR
ncbi:UNVERIFIED_CONTAM: hypothetical protein Slati_3516400, partial [Sesamum latifolium]